jgi:riboflavin kinase/FMN adenylyltransferase
LLGFPTANLSDIQTLIPAAGVYAGWAAVDGETLPAAIHIGPNPTFAESLPKVEVHLLDQSRQLYGLNLDVDFVRRIRGVVKFDSAEGLKRQIEVDLRGVREALGRG